MDKDKLNRVEDKIDRISEKLNEINVVMAENTQSLIIHEKRTDLAEKKLALLEVEFREKSTKDNINMSQIEAKLEPIHNHVLLLNAAFKYVIPALAATLAFLYKLGIVKF